MHLHIVDFHSAKAHGLKRYFTGKPCQYRQFAERRTSTRECLCFICQAKNAQARYESRKEYGVRNRKELSQKINDKRKADRRKPQNPTFIKV